MHMWPRTCSSGLCEFLRSLVQLRMRSMIYAVMLYQKVLDFFYKLYIKILYISLRHVPFQLYVTVQIDQRVLVRQVT